MDRPVRSIPVPAGTPRYAPSTSRYALPVRVRYAAGMHRYAPGVPRYALDCRRCKKAGMLPGLSQYAPGTLKFGPCL